MKLGRLRVLSVTLENTLLNTLLWLKKNFWPYYQRCSDERNGIYSSFYGKAIKGRGGEHFFPTHMF
jgi:hypothetical protein